MYQKLTFVGFLGSDPEMRYTPSGQPVTSFSVAASRAYKDGTGRKVKETTWYRVTAWSKLAENTNAYLHKGSKVLVEGRLTPDAVTGGPKIFARRDGTAGANFEVVADVVVFMDSKDENPPAEEEQMPYNGGVGEEAESEFPF